MHSFTYNFNAFIHTSLLFHTRPLSLSLPSHTYGCMHALVPRSPLATQSYGRVHTTASQQALDGEDARNNVDIVIASAAPGHVSKKTRARIATEQRECALERMHLTVLGQQLDEAMAEAGNTVKASRRAEASLRLARVEAERTLAVEPSMWPQEGSHFDALARRTTDDTATTMTSTSPSAGGAAVAASLGFTSPDASSGKGKMTTANDDDNLDHNESGDGGKRAEVRAKTLNEFMGGQRLKKLQTMLERQTVWISHRRAELARRHRRASQRRAKLQDRTAQLQVWTLPLP